MNRLRRLLSSSEYNLLHPAFWFGDVDARQLGLFRMLFAALMVKEALYHLLVAELWYSDAGMFPLRLLPRIAPDTPTLMAGLGDTNSVRIFFMLWVVVAVLLLVGWWTRVMSIANFIILVSVINRSPFVVTGADSVMQVMAFWSLFVPLGRCYSLDARGRPAECKPRTYAFPVRMLQLQFVLVYVFTTIFKLEGQTWVNGDALYMAMQVRMHTFPICDWLLVNASQWLLRVLTFITLVIEGGFAIAVLSPIGQPLVRRVGLVAGVILHVAIGVVMNVPNFPLVMMTCYLLLLDSGWVDGIESWLGRWNVSRLWIRRESVSAETQPLRGCAGTVLAMSRGVSTGAYRGLVACGLLVVMVFVLWGNLLTNDTLMVGLGIPAMPSSIEAKLRAVGLWEGWTMFAPNPLGFEGYFTIIGYRADGTEVDLRGSRERERWFLGPLARWGKLEENLMLKAKDDPLFPAWGQAICKANSDIEQLMIVLNRRATSPQGEPFRPYEAEVIYEGTCS